MVIGRLVGAVVVAAVVGANASAAAASTAYRHHRHAQLAAAQERPLTIGPRRGIYRQGDDIIAPGGFSAHGYGYPQATPEERKAAYNAHLRDAARLYGSGIDGLGGWGYNGDPAAGYTNPYYGNTFSRYVGYNGVPSDLAFGPAFANRRIANHDPNDPDDEQPGPSPGDLGYVASPDE